MPFDKNAETRVYLDELLMMNIDYTLAKELLESTFLLVEGAILAGQPPTIEPDLGKACNMDAHASCHDGYTRT